MNFKIFDLYAAYLLRVCTMVTATNIAALFNFQISHDQSIVCSTATNSNP